MKKQARVGDELRPGCDLSELLKGGQGKYAERCREGTNLVLLALDVAAAFPDEKAVTEAQRLVMQLTRIPRAEQHPVVSPWPSRPLTSSFMHTHRDGVARSPLDSSARRRMAGCLSSGSLCAASRALAIVRGVIGQPKPPSYTQRVAVACGFRWLATMRRMSWPYASSFWRPMPVI